MSMFVYEYLFLPVFVWFQSSEKFKQNWDEAYTLAWLALQVPMAIKLNWCVLLGEIYSFWVFKLHIIKTTNLA